MTVQPKQDVTPEAYVAFDRASDGKNEYFDGTVYAMAGGSVRHNRIAGSTYATLYRQLRQRNCNIYSSDMRVKVAQTGLYTYPDITIICGNEQYEDESEDILLNPIIIIEVLSPSTEKYDRGKKFHQYRSILALREYILIAQDEYHIEKFTRQSDNTWVFSEAIGRDGSLELRTIQCTLRLEEVYEKVDFSREAPDQEAGSAA